ncbi:MAG: hypothetical protein KC708_02575 [Anaerolineae bacterium]|nr:hypothetical protein [Anaerolineae bacterium]
MAPKISRNRKRQFVFRRHQTIGAADAQEDTKYLQSCFVDVGDLEVLEDMSDPKCIVLGRTGSGKTALLEMLNQKNSRTVKVSPDNLALTFLSNNAAIRFYLDAGINMQLFFRVLWKHVFIVELLKLHFDIYDVERQNRFLETLKSLKINRKSAQAAREYLVRHGETFLKETDYRIKELTTTLEKRLNKATHIVGKAHAPHLMSAELNHNYETAKNLTEEEKAEIVRLGQPVVDQQQMSELNEVMVLLKAHLLTDPKKSYFISIDRLDEDWIHDDLRYKLIRALFETVRDFNKTFRDTGRNRRYSCAKIVIAIRQDLLERMFRRTRYPGDQEEKYASLYLKLFWGEKALTELVDLRVNQLIREKYTNESVSLKAILPRQIDKQNPVGFIIDRTMHAPRDIIHFFNLCIAEAEGKARIDAAMLYKAEATYSKDRLRALADEWSADYRNLIEIIKLLRNQRRAFTLDSFDKKRFSDLALDFLIVYEQEPNAQDYLYKLVEEKIGTDELIFDLIKLYYRVGAVGINMPGIDGVYWSFQGDSVYDAEIDKHQKYHIHPGFWRVLGINT